MSDPDDVIVDLESIGTVEAADLDALDWVKWFTVWRCQVELMRPEIRHDARVQRAASKLSFRLPVAPNGVVTPPCQPVMQEARLVAFPRREGWVTRLWRRLSR